MVYSDAEDYCEQAGGYLTSMHDGFEKDFFEGLASPFGVDSFWIGGSDKFNATWQWEDNSPFDFNDWAPGIGF
uniref:C-type lectin domain-containing protein n=1 Tax=Panagrolaimus davidi TaxID=227884 RepID=A0A914PLB3_9BILA